jgi:hypothetical protein
MRAVDLAILRPSSCFAPGRTAALRHPRPEVVAAAEVRGRRCHPRRQRRPSLQTVRAALPGAQEAQ